MRLLLFTIFFKTCIQMSVSRKMIDKNCTHTFIIYDELAVVVVAIDYRLHHAESYHVVSAVVVVVVVVDYRLHRSNRADLYRVVPAVVVG